MGEQSRRTGETPEDAVAHPAFQDPARLDRFRHRHEHFVEETLHPPEHRMLGYGLVTLCLVSILLAAFFLTPLPESAGPDCDAKPGPGIDWSGCHLERLVAPGVNLAGANLRNTSLREAHLFEARMKHVDASYAELIGSFLRGADIFEGSLVGANLREADLTLSTLRGADLSYADLTGAHLAGADLAGARLRHAIWVDGSVCAASSVGACLTVE